MSDEAFEEQVRRFRRLSVSAARAADDKKGGDILLLNIGGISSLADFLLVISVTSPPHMEAVAEHIRLTIKAEGLYALHQDGKGSDVWRVMDYGGLIVHLMHPRSREFYALEKLFHGGKKVRWRKQVRRTSRPRGPGRPSSRGRRRPVGAGATKKRSSGERHG